MPMTAADRDFAAKHLAESRDRLVALVRGLSPTQTAYKPAPERWSIAENLEHVILVEHRGRGFVENALKQAPDPARHSGYPGSAEGLVAMLRDRSHPRRGVEQIQPAGRWPHDQLLKEFEAARKRTCELLAATTADLHAHFSPHPLFGDLSCFQWLLVLAAHCDRHRAQSEEVMASEGFPRAAAAV
ncbi:MAG TPA: DinB family protein [Candidatus Acidoferrales bacterium]|nr:DinB family protein [Candidatus Acidoferrales bacterium]